MLTDQWFVKADILAEEALAAVTDGRTKFVPDNWKKTYDNWMNDIQPWCISRQLWWGHRIPAWYDEDGNITVAPDEKTAQKKAGSTVKLTRDPDVLDTWFSSGYNFLLGCTHDDARLAFHGRSSVQKCLYSRPCLG